MVTTSRTSLGGLARALVQQGRLEEGEAEALSATAAAQPGGFAHTLLARGSMAAKELASFAAGTFGYPLFDLSAYTEERVVRDAIDGRLMQARLVVALLRRGNHIIVAMADPTELGTLEDIRFQTGLTVDPVVVEGDKLTALVARMTGTEEKTLQNFADEYVDLDVDVEVVEENADTAHVEVDDAPVVKYIQKILRDAVNEGASDVHFEPYEKYYRIRYRCDGILREVAQPPLMIKDKIASRLKIISRLDISEKRVPQDGRLKMMLARNHAFDFRISTLPTLNGEKIVARILDPSSALMGIDTLGYEASQRQALVDAIQRPYGMVLVTGPTGSGKTVTLYTCLNLLNTPSVNIATAEDPAEISLPGVNQVNINEKTGLTFAAALRSFLRQDPDIIMVGEIRDLDTAEIAIKAAQTGHLVLSTLHTNDAPTTLSRLLSMGLAAFNIASSVTLVAAQRLVRCLCTCKRPVSIPAEALIEAGFTEEELEEPWQQYAPGSCERCKGSGYKGRIGVYQVMPVSEDIARLIMTGGNAMDIAEQARSEGVMDLRRAGLLKVRRGITSLEEVLACTND